MRLTIILLRDNYKCAILEKLPEKINRDDLLVLWLSLFKANTEEELTQIAELGVTELSEAVTAYHNVTASYEFQEIERQRITTSLNEAQALNNAARKAEKAKALEIARKMLKRNRPIDEVIEDTGLTLEDVEELKDA